MVIVNLLRNRILEYIIITEKYIIYNSDCVIIWLIIGSVLSAFFEKFENIVIFSLVYDYLAVALSGAYISLG
jgi:hypothetical protein